MNGSIDLHSVRAQKARLAKRLGDSSYRGLLIIALVCGLCAFGLLFINQHRFAYLITGAALLSGIIAVWYKRDLLDLPPTGEALTGRLSADVLANLNPKQALTAPVLWQELQNHWQVRFFTNHFLLPADLVETALLADLPDLALVWAEADRLSRVIGTPLIEPGHIAAALMLSSPGVLLIFTQLKLVKEDITAVADWLDRALEHIRAPKPYFGGVGRDWANGFTPQLNQFGHNISLGIESGGGGYFASLTDSPGVLAIKNAFSQGASAIALIGEDGIGKTSSVHALAKVLLEERNDRNLEHRQIVELSPSAILSSAQQQGELENIVITLLNETSHAGNIILFLDDAQLFFTTSTGAFDMTHILLPAIQSHGIQMVLAMNPHDYQQLKSNNSAFANLLTPVVLTEPSESEVMAVLEDTSLGLENKHGVLIAYEAIREAYRLSGRYDQDLAYPGKAINLLTQAVSHGQGGVINAESVQATIEQTHGVKVGTAVAAEADTLLNLEDKIHERMINQTQAVGVVASALRRARAGVSNPKRPIGTFLFLGPTGVGKTELAKAVAATYFGAESNMVRLDMSEYQQPEDVSRLLSDGQSESKSLIMAVRQQPFCVILLDEIEKAHPNILNLLLQLLDEGQLTDSGGRAASFRDCIIVATSNAGAQTIRDRVEQGETVESFQPLLIDELIHSGQFKPELLNRFDEMVLFRPLTPSELSQVVGLMMKEINQTLAVQNIFVELTPAAIEKIVTVGYDPRLGARPMRRTLQKAVENTVAQKILRAETNPGDSILLDIADLSL